MILGVFKDFFGVKIVIGLSKNHCDLILTVGFDLSQNSRYLPIFYRYLPLFYRYLLIYLRYFFINSSTYVREIKSRNFIEISGISDISAIFFDFSPIFWPIDYRLAISFRGPPITDISAEKTEILFLG